MKTSQWMTRIIASTAIAFCGSTFADAGSVGVGNSFSGFESTKSRAEVLAELDSAKAQGLLLHSEADLRQSGSAPNIGARGPAGSRFTGRTREEVRAELMEFRRTQQVSSPTDIYFPN
ncbi:MAG TPA: DUF4148 domain-containing protein [Noviherbaspirillum sp.]|uniref:DUF4148 domain-containing protein n=1 Tax=Noviherbaspirillum sp. TaxID=1926288 RepID=UPI002D47B5D6|nr:DUF4148 domain-containing protein [Noviherbaspirillum sp.]HYD94686.1 DUF4148 domain-containing protein [Noviherbaspirillum sp.]